LRFKDIGQSEAAYTAERKTTDFEKVAP